MNPSLPSTSLPSLAPRPAETPPALHRSASDPASGTGPARSSALADLSAIEATPPAHDTFATPQVRDTHLTLSHPEQPDVDLMAAVREPFAPLRARITADNFHDVSGRIDRLPRDRRADAIAARVERMRQAFDRMESDIALELSEHFDAAGLRTALQRADSIDAATMTAQGALKALVFNGGGVAVDVYAKAGIAYLQERFQLDEQQAGRAYAGLVGLGLTLVDGATTGHLVHSTFGARPYYGHSAAPERDLHPAMAAFLRDFCGPPPDFIDRLLSVNQAVAGYNARNVAQFGLKTLPGVRQIPWVDTVIESGGGLAAGVAGESMVNRERAERQAFGPAVLLASNERLRLLDDAAKGMFDAMRLARGAVRLTRVPTGLVTALVPPTLLPSALGGRPAEQLSTPWQRWAPPLVQDLVKPSTLLASLGIGVGFHRTTAAKQDVKAWFTDPATQQMSAVGPTMVDATNVIGKALAYLLLAIGISTGADLGAWLARTQPQATDAEDDEESRPLEAPGSVDAARPEPALAPR